MSEETGWLIERNDLGAPQWCIFGPRHKYTSYTTNASEALRFARKIDAEAFMRHHENNDPALRVTEHKWLDVHAAPQLPRPLTEAELHEMTSEPETADQIVERVSAHLRAEIKAIFAAAKTRSATAERD